MLPWQPFLAFYIRGAHWRHLKNTTEPSMCGGDAALCQITSTTSFSSSVNHCCDSPVSRRTSVCLVHPCKIYLIYTKRFINKVSSHSVHSAVHTHMNRPFRIGFCLTGLISLCLGSFLCMYYFVCGCILHACVVL